MKVVHIATMLKGGAAIAAQRIHQGLLDYIQDVESSFVQKDPVTRENIYQCTNYHNTYYRIVNKLGLVPYLTKEGRFRRAISKYPCNYEMVTLPLSYYPIENHPIVRNADIIHLHWTGDFINYPSFFKNVKQPIVWTTHDMNPFLGLFHYEEDVLRNQKKLGKLESQVRNIKYNGTHAHNNIHVVCPSMWVKEKSESSSIFGDFPHYLIPYGIEPKQYPLLEKESIKKEFGLDNKKKTIIFIAFDINIYRKGIDLLTDAIKQIDPDRLNLLSIGHGHELSFDNRINYRHYDNIRDISELNKFYTAADITIIPSREDMFNQVMLESLINGTPVISFSNGGMAEHIKTGKNGILIDKISADSLKSGINNFLDNKYNFETSSVIRSYPIENLNSELQAKRYIELYNNILSK